MNIEKLNSQPIPSLYEWIGGKEVLIMLFSRFYNKVLKDEILSPIFKNMSSAHIERVAFFVAEVFGGPKLYSQGETQRTHSTMVAHHLGKMLNEQLRKRWVQLLLETADETNIKTDPEFRSALLAYLEWGSRIAVLNSQLHINPLKEEEAMPKWGWGEPGRPYLADN